MTHPRAFSIPAGSPREYHHAVGLTPVCRYGSGPRIFHHTTGPVHASTSKQGYTVTISGTVTSIDWGLGDGSEAITCTSWKPAHPTMTTINTPVICGRQEGYSRQGIYTITATSNWSIAWQGIGESGTITIPVTSTATVKIGELQALNTTDKQRYYYKKLGGLLDNVYGFNTTWVHARAFSPLPQNVLAGLRLVERCLGAFGYCLRAANPIVTCVW